MREVVNTFDCCIHCPNGCVSSDEHTVECPNGCIQYPNNNGPVDITPKCGYEWRTQEAPGIHSYHKCKLDYDHVKKHECACGEEN